MFMQVRAGRWVVRNEWPLLEMILTWEVLYEKWMGFACRKKNGHIMQPDGTIGRDDGSRDEAGDRIQALMQMELE